MQFSLRITRALAGPLLLVCIGSAQYAHAPLSIWRTAAFTPSVAGGISHDPHERLQLRFTLENVGSDSVVLNRFICRVVRTRAMVGNPHSIWDAPYRNIELIAEWPLGKVLAPGSGELLPGRTVMANVTLTPGKYGHFSIMVAPAGSALDDGYRAAAFAVVYPPAKEPRPDSFFLATSDDTMGRGATDHFVIPARYGIKWLRLALAPHITDDHELNWEVGDRIATGLRGHGLLALNDISAWNGPLPSIGGKPVTYFWGRKVNLIPPPELFSLYARQVTETVQRYGDVAPAGYLRNEPWEKGSISFYHGTGRYYGDWLKVAATAAKEASPAFSVLAADAITNFEDNIQMRGLADFVDITSHHADIEQDRGVVQSAALGKRAWETEDWISHYDAYLVANLTMKIAHGFAKSNPGDPGLYLTQAGHNGHPDWRYVPNGPVLLPAPAGQAVSTWLHFVDDTQFMKEIGPTHLPWIFLFASPDAVDGKHAAVVIGRIKAYGYDYHRKDGDIAWPSITAFGRLLVRDAERTLAVYDFSGNALARDADGGFTIPLNEDAHYVTSSCGAEDVATKLAVAQAAYDGSGIEVSLLDFTRPLAMRPPVRVRVKNGVQASSDVDVRLTAPAGWRLSSPIQSLKALQPGESRDLVFEVAEVREVPSNLYPFTVEAVSAGGTQRLEENLHVAIFRRGTVTVDGDLADWEKIGAVPVTIAGGVAAADSVEKYWFPFLDLPATDSTGTRVRFAGAWDDEYFYVCAEVSDAAPQFRPSMEKGIWFTQHEAPLDFLYWGVTPQFVSTVGDGLKIAFDLNRPGEKHDPWLPPEAQRKVDARFSQLSADYEYDLYPGVQNQLAEPYAAVRDRHLALLANPPDDAYRGTRPPFEEPAFVTVGEPMPEVWRLMAPGVPRHNYYPFSKRVERDQGLVAGAKLAIKRVGNAWRYEAAIPWSELAGVKPAVGREVRFSFYALNDGKRAAAWAQGRSASGRRTQILHPTWLRTEAIETVWSFQDFAR